MRSTSTIDKLYDQYKLQDWDINADNLNPKREMLMGQVKQLEKAIQSLTDDIVRKRITPKQEDIEMLTTSFGGESTVGNLGKTIASINAGSDDGTIFGEGLPSDVEEQIALLQAELGPVVIDCKKILSKYNFDVASSEDIDDEDGEHTYVVNTDDIDSSNGPKTNDVLKELDLDGLQNDDCAAADLTILKIFIAILKIFQIIVKILQFLLELPTILAELIELAAMCWINPPSIALLVQIILDLITSLIVALISNLIKFLWDLLGLDCISQQATDLLDNIQDLISKFKNTAALIDIGAVGFMFDGISTQIDNISDLIKKSINDMKEDWNEAVNKVKDYFSEEGLENLKEAAIDAAVNTLQDEYSEAVGGNTNATINKGINDVTRSLAHGTIIEDAKNKAIKSYNDTTKAYYNAMATATSAMDNLKESFARMQDSATKLGEFVSDLSIDDLEIE
jgi:division protein CdvB (Snf7/Vps24/ESCRT-III family)